MEITHPRRILVLSSPTTDLAPIINQLVPPLEKGTDSSKTKEVQPVHDIQTPYYKAKVPIWTDHVENPIAWKEEWTEQDGAADVVGAVGAWIVAFPKPSTAGELNSIKSLLTSIASVLTHHTSTSYDMPFSDSLQLAIALPTSSTLSVSAAEWDDICREHGNWEYIDAAASGAPNEFGEKTGLPRLVEALQSGEWESSADMPSDPELDDILDEADEDLEKGFDPARAGEDAGVKDPILGSLRRQREGNRTGPAGDYDDDDDDDVEALQNMLGRLQAAKELGADLPQAERRKLAREAVRGVMKEL